MTTDSASGPPPIPPALPSLPPSPPPSALLAEPRVVPAGAPMQWITTGWEMFKAFPGPWIAIVIVYVIVTAVIGVLPVIGIVNVVVGPILAAGVVAACEAQRGGTPPRVEHLFAGFQTATANLALVGVLYLGGLLVVVLMVGGGGFAAMLPFIVAASAGEQFSVSPGMIGMVLLFVLIGLLLVIPLGLAMMWAPPLVFVHGVGPVEALKRSLFACLRNWLALLVMIVLVAVLGGIAMIPLGLGLLVFAPVMAIAIWAGYREVFVA